MALLVGLVRGMVLPARACGPYFPNSLLEEGEGILLAVPHSSLHTLLSQLQIPRSEFLVAVPPPAYATRAGINEQTVEAEYLALELRLEAMQMEQQTREEVLSKYAAARAALNRFMVAQDQWRALNEPAADSDEEESEETGDEKVGEPPSVQVTPEPLFPAIQWPSGLPGEYQLYLRGAAIWHNPRIESKAGARKLWQQLLELPPKERQDKSVWAAFMIGRSWEGIDLPKARAAFQLCRSLARSGYADPTGLAAASLGLEARECLHARQYEAANSLYLEQFAARDPSAMQSILVLGRDVMSEDDETLARLASVTRLRQVVTACLLCEGARALDEQGPEPSRGQRWLRALENAGVQEAELAENLALLAYQEGDMKAAERWSEMSGDAAMGQWIRAKLLLRGGKVKPAVEILSGVVKRLQDAAHPEQGNAKKWVSGEVQIRGRFVSVQKQVAAELGVLQVVQGDFLTAALSLVRGGNWTDAAYVPERIITTDELKSLVDRHFSREPIANIRDSDVDKAPSDKPIDEPWNEEAQLRTDLRYLLARRLAREMRFDEARAYYPDEWQGQLDRLVGALRAGRDESTSGESRGRALFEAALITRTNGLELLGTELAPDWRMHDGQYERSLSAQQRAENKDLNLLKPTPEELTRYEHHKPDPDRRWHYRYQAAGLAWEAAGLLPDNSDETAYVLWRAGTWLKVTDPKTADYFYKALVRRNRKTALGDAADRMRWFPRADDNALPILEPQPTVESVPQEEVAPEPMSEESMGEGVQDDTVAPARQ